MKTEQQKTDRKLLVGIVLFLLFITIILGTLCFYKHYCNENSNIPEQIAKELENMDFGFFNGNDSKIRTVADVAVPIIEKLVKETNNKEEMAAKLEDSLFNCGLSFTREEAAVLAEWLIEFYTTNYMEDSDSSLPEISDAEYKNILVNEMHQDLDSIYEYLSKLDETVINNKNEIVNLTTGQTGSFESVTVYLDSLNSTIKNLQKQFSAYENEYQDTQNTTTSEFSSITLQLDNISESIMNTQSEISANIHNIDNSNAERYESLNSTINNFASSFRKDLDTVNKNISKLIGELKMENNQKNDELTLKLLETHEELLQVLDTMDEEWSIAVETAFTNMSNHMTEAEERLTQEIDTGVDSLLTNLEYVHTNISNTQEEIKTALRIMKEVNDENMADIISRFTNINNKLVEINKDIDNTHEEIKDIINSLQVITEENQEELLTVLTDFDSSFTEQNNQNYELMVNSLKTQTDTVKQWFEGLNSSVTSNFEDLSNTVDSIGGSIEQSANSNKEELLNNFNQSFTNLSSSVDNISQTVADNKNDIISRIAELEIKTTDNYNNISNDLQSVFQSASNGKQLLASALLAKSVNIAKDATYQEFYNAILTIDQQIVIGVEQIPGTITYEYHYHEGDAADGSGCYTKKLYHQHSPECYTKATCTVTVHANGGFWSEGDDWCPCHGNVHKIKQNVIRKHSSCGAPDNYGQISFTEHHGPGIDGFHGYDSSTHSYDKLSCGKTNATFVGWDVGCGFVDGQIIGAYIVYDQAAQNASLSTRMTTLKNYIPKVYDDYVRIQNDTYEKMEEQETETETMIEGDIIMIEGDIIIETKDQKESQTEIEKQTETDSSETNPETKDETEKEEEESGRDSAEAEEEATESVSAPVTQTEGKEEDVSDTTEKESIS